MRNTFITRRAPAGLAMVLATIGLFAGPVGAQSTPMYAVLTNGAGSVVAQLAGNGLGIPTTAVGVSLNPSTGQSSPLPVGTKVTPLYVVAPGSGMTINAIAGIKPPASVKCPANQLPTLILPASGPKSVMAPANWHCKAGGV